MNRTASALLAACALAACAPRLAPVVAPVPAAPPPNAAAAPAAAPVVSPGASADSVRAASDSASAAVKPACAGADSATVTDRDVADCASSVFGDSAAAADSARPSWDIDVRSYETRDRVQRYLAVFTGSAKDHITQQIERGTRYEGMIRAQFRAAGLPEDMYYLGLIESGYDPNAYSKAAAVGMWQFMAGTARGEGLRVDWWIDERRDPVKSTAAAARFIKGLRDQFGSLYLAAAAYDGGPGRIQRGLTRYADALQDTQGDDLYFALSDKDYLRAETREYVPRLIAAALVAKDPKRYGLDIVPESTFVYDSVRVGPLTSLAAIAAAAGTTVAELQDLDPQILRGMAPPDDSIDVRIPLGAAAGFGVRFAALPESLRVGARTVRARAKKFASTIARKYGLTEHELEEFNPHLKRYASGHLVVGQAVLVPTRVVADAARNVPNPSIELYGLADGLHVVRKGETLSGLAAKYHTTVARIKALNGLRHDTIRIGQKLRVSR